MLAGKSELQRKRATENETIKLITNEVTE